MAAGEITGTAAVAAAPGEEDLSAFLKAVADAHGLDFRRYAVASLRRRVRQAMAKWGLSTVGELQLRAMGDPVFFRLLLGELTVSVTEMFRQPSFFARLRQDVLPVLRTYPALKVWVAGCSTGEEAYSVAQILREEGLYERSIIYATDVNPAAVEQAREGIYAVDDIRRYADNYREARGVESFTSLFTVAHGHGAIDPSLKRNIHFAEHNLGGDSVFGQMHVILCRNVLIYFDRSLQDDALELFDSSLVHGGFLCLGSTETLARARIAGGFAETAAGTRIYRKRAP